MLPQGHRKVRNGGRRPPVLGPLKKNGPARCRSNTFPSFLRASSSSTSSSDSEGSDDQLGSQGTQVIGTNLPMTASASTRASASVSLSSSSAPSSPTPKQKRPALKTRVRSSSTNLPISRLGSISLLNQATLLLPVPLTPPVSLNAKPALKSMSHPRLPEIQEPSSQSPPPYSPLEHEVERDFNFHGVCIGAGPSQPRVDRIQSHASTPSFHPQPHLSYTSPSNPSLNSHPASSSATYSSPFPHTRSRNQSLPHLRRRSAAGSGPGSRIPSPMNSETEGEEGAIYTSSRLRHHHSTTTSSNSTTNGNGNSLLQEDADGSSSSSTIQAAGGTKGKAKSKKTWSWRHWVFALAAGIVGFWDVDDHGSDTRESEKEEKVICTTPGGVCAGETETETDEPSRHLPTARIIPSSESSPHDFRHRLIPLLFEFSRLLAIVPAVFGTLWNLYRLFSPPRSTGDDVGGLGRRFPPDRVDFFVAALWSILTGYQCLALTTGLLRRWQAYYPPLSTLIRLLALQGICWPATQITLSVLDVARRPVICWCVVGTTTCASRSVQIWVTSNIVLEGGDEETKGGTSNMNGHVHPIPHPPPPHTHSDIVPTPHPQTTRIQPRPRPRGRWMYTSRRWDWKEVGVKCVLPAGVVYFIMAWLGEMRREWAGC